jgi:hypothetical protein
MSSDRAPLHHRCNLDVEESAMTRNTGRVVWAFTPIRGLLMGTVALGSALVVLSPRLSAGVSTQDRTVPMRAVTITAIADPVSRRAQATVTTSIATFFGPVPLRSRIEANVDCAGAFEGSIGFHPLVRLLARLKGISLATHIVGRLEPPCGGPCLPLPVDTLVGSVTVHDKMLEGVVRLAGDSVRIAGRAWMVADTAYHGLVHATHANGTTDVVVTVIERGRKSRAPVP